MKKLLTLSFIATGILFHLAAAVLIYAKPQTVYQAWYYVNDRLARKLPGLFANDAKIAKDIDVDLGRVLPKWQPLAASRGVPAGQARIGDRIYEGPVQASKALQDGDTLLIGKGHYKQALVITADNVRIEGDGGVHFSHAQQLGKGSYVVKGNNVLIRNIECSQIRVPDRNGSCIRHEGRNLTVEHVYLHDSEQGILTGRDPGLVTIRDSRFERLGQSGQAHGIYIGGGRLFIEDSVFLASKSEGHEIKSRAKAALIMNSIIASLDGRDSRLIDLPNGGDFTLVNSVLEQGPHSSNGDVIGYALERRAVHGSVSIKNNIFILERAGTNRLFHANKPVEELSFSGNIVISSARQETFGAPLTGTYYGDRKSAGIAPYPALPEVPRCTAAPSGSPPPLRSGCDG